MKSRGAFIPLWDYFGSFKAYIVCCSRVLGAHLGYISFNSRSTTAWLEGFLSALPWDSRQSSTFAVYEPRSDVCVSFRPAVSLSSYPRLSNGHGYFLYSTTQGTTLQENENKRVLS